MKLIKSQKIYKGKVFVLKKDTIKMNGHTLTRDIIHHPGSALMIPVLDVKKKKLILIKQYRYAAGGTIFEFPAGTKDPKESYQACASRELIEEIGYRAKKIKLITKFYLAPGTMTEVMGMFLCFGLVKEQQDLEIDEQIIPHVTTLDKAVKMVVSGRIKDAKTITAVMMLKNIYEDKGLYRKFFSPS